MKENTIEQKVLHNILKLMLTEFIGRCLSVELSKKKMAFTMRFANKLSESNERKSWYEEMSNSVIENYTLPDDKLLRKYYYPEKMIKEILLKVRGEYKRDISEKVKNLGIKFNSDKIDESHNTYNVGNIRWKVFKSWAKEVGIENIEELFSDDMIMVYISHLQKYKTSKERMSNPLLSIEETKKEILQQIIRENSYEYRCYLQNRIKKVFKEKWDKLYESAHKNLIFPLTKEEIIAKANERNIEVNASNFDKIYKYRKSVGLLRNACMSEQCPHYLVPNNSFNQHISVGRQKSTFPHNIHIVTSTNKEKIAKDILDLVCIENPKRRKKIKTQPMSDEEKTKFIIELPDLINKYKMFSISKNT